MGFRELVDGSRVSDSPVSVEFDMKRESEISGNEPILFNEITETPGHRAAISYSWYFRACY